MRRLSRRMAQEKKGMRRRTKADLFQPQVHLMMVQSYQIPKKNSKTVISHFHLTSASNKLAEKVQDSPFACLLLLIFVP